MPEHRGGQRQRRRVGTLTLYLRVRD